MFSSPTARKFARVALTTGALGATLAALFLGAPADAAVHFASRGV